MTEEYKTTLLLKAALEFNAAVMAIATRTVAAKDTKLRTVGRELSRLFENYHKRVSLILKEGEEQNVTNSKND